MLQIRLFGGLDVRRDDQPVHQWKRHSDRLLALLTLNHDRPLRNEWIITALGIPESSLPHSLSELYEVLGTDRERIRHANRQVFFDTEQLDVDLFKFERFIQIGSIDSLQEAIKLFQGRLLKGWDEEGWFTEEAEDYLADFLDAIDTLARASVEARDFVRAARYLRRYVEVMPEMDSAWARLMEVYREAGDESAIAKTYQEYLAALRKRAGDGEGIAPAKRVLDACAGTAGVTGVNREDRGRGSPATVHEDPSCVPSAERTAHQADVREPVGGAVPLHSPFYIERQVDRDALAAVRRGDSFILIKGPRQVGKSSLLVRLSRAAADPAGKGGGLPCGALIHQGQEAGQLHRRADSAGKGGGLPCGALIHQGREAGQPAAQRRDGRADSAGKGGGSRRADSGARIVRTDWQKSPRSTLQTVEAFLMDLADTFVDQLELDVQPAAHFGGGLPATKCFERFLRRRILSGSERSLVWVIDEADRLFDCPFRDDIFGMLRSWHNERANDFSGVWDRLTVVMAYATEAYLFISDLNQSPFNVGSRYDLDDFTPEEVAALNARYGAPLDDSGLKSLLLLAGGHPYLVRRCLLEIAANGRTVAGLEQNVADGGSLFGDHLDRIRLALRRDPEVEAAARAMFHAGPPPDFAHFVRLRAAGIVRGTGPESMQPRCKLYEIYLRRALQ